MNPVIDKKLRRYEQELSRNSGKASNFFDACEYIKTQPMTGNIYNYCYYENETIEYIYERVESISSREEPDGPTRSASDIQLLAYLLILNRVSENAACFAATIAEKAPCAIYARKAAKLILGGEADRLSEGNTEEGLADQLARETAARERAEKELDQCMTSLKDLVTIHQNRLHDSQWESMIETANMVHRELGEGGLKNLKDKASDAHEVIESCLGLLNETNANASEVRKCLEGWIDRWVSGDSSK